MSKILDLKNYDVVFTTSFFYTHGVSGHLYELIDYYYISSISGLKCAILLADGITKDIFKTAITDKYDFSSDELSHILSDTIECFQPKIIMSKNICIVDGSWRVLNCTIYADNAFLLRCSEDDFTYFSNSKSIKRSHLMQDFKLYPERFEDLDIEVVDYIKKILWGRYKVPKTVKTNTAMMYLTTNCRALSLDDTKKIIDKRICDNYLIITNKPEIYSSLVSDTVRVEQAPIKDIFEQFDTYVYTTTDLQKDCSPRFIVECAVFGKEVIYEIDYISDGVERRKQDIADNLAGIKLTNQDYFVEYVKQCLNT